MKIKNLLSLASIFILFTFCSCGRKIRNIYSFDEQENRRINKLSLPIVQGVAAKKTPHGNLISWFAIDVPQDKNFAGYNVYHLVRTNIIPKHSCNKNPLQTTTFLDSKKHHTKKPGYYLVRAAFTHNDSIIEGPISHIVYIQD